MDVFGGKSVHLFPWFGQPPSLFFSHYCHTQYATQRTTKQAWQSHNADEQSTERKIIISGAQCLFTPSFSPSSSHVHTSPLVDTVDSRWRSNAEVELVKEPIDIGLFLLDRDEMEAWAEVEDVKISFE